ncbi:hypothetical protein K7X08_033511 [Anisodus acutangulus]|uniref:RING-type E3 ubiquitin transferase n=1 Tax=Anisodus acutangulus TaxID=402998 RepID=A0A9Q1M1S7_9SOLA|nr:hypothetical protein K7X08_033511 [Anisodus acutangulus]
MSHSKFTFMILIDYLVPCLGSSGYQVHAVSSTTNLDNFLYGPCTKIHQYPYSLSTFYDNKLQLNWPIPLCGNCESKGMDCGFKNGTQVLETHCFNRTMTQKGITKQPLIAGVVLGTALVCIIVFSINQLYLTRKELKIRIEEEGDGAIVRKLAIVGLWCIQWHPIDRPSIKEVTYMLEGDVSHLNLSPNPFMATNTPKFNASPHTEDLDVILEIE